MYISFSIFVFGLFLLYIAKLTTVLHEANSKVSGLQLENFSQVDNIISQAYCEKTYHQENEFIRLKFALHGVFVLSHAYWFSDQEIDKR